jgi:hypothetical protein
VAGMAPRSPANAPTAAAPAMPRSRRTTSRRDNPPAHRLISASNRSSSTRAAPCQHHRYAHRPTSPQYPEQHSGQLSPQLQESEQYPPVPAHGASQSLGLEQTPAPPGVPGDDAQQTSPSLHGCNVPVAHPHPIYVQLNPARLGAGAPAARSAPASAAIRPNAPRRDCRNAIDLAAASNRAASIGFSPPHRPIIAQVGRPHRIAIAAQTQEESLASAQAAAGLPGPGGRIAHGARADSQNPLPRGML